MRKPRGDQLDHFHPFGHVEEGTLAGIVGHGDDDPVEHPEAPGDDVRMAVGDGIECAGVDPEFHGERSPSVWSLNTDRVVSP